MEKLKQKVSEYQITTKTYNNYESDGYSQYQNYLYKRALYGLNSLTQEELNSMCSKKKQRISNVYKRAQLILNILKQKITIEYSNYIFKTLFPNSPYTESICSLTETDDKFTNILTFKDLNIKKEQIISIFMSEGILPKNFLSLENSPNQLPRLRNDKT